MTAINKYIWINLTTSQLGIVTKNREMNVDMLLGNILVDSISSESPSKEQGLKERDYIVTVNNEYLAFGSYENCISRIQQAIRPFKMLICRPIKKRWEAVLRSDNALILSGFLEKQSHVGGIYKHWTNREFILTKTDISYKADGVLREKMSVREILRLIPITNVGLAGGENEEDKAKCFEVKMQEKEFLLKAKSVEEKMVWLHHIDICMRRGFENFNEFNLEIMEEEEELVEAPIRKQLPKKPPTSSINEKSSEEKKERKPLPPLPSVKKEEPMILPPVPLKRNPSLSHLTYPSLHAAKIKIVGMGEEDVAKKEEGGNAKWSGEEKEQPIDVYDFAFETTFLSKRNNR